MAKSRNEYVEPRPQLNNDSTNVVTMSYLEDQTAIDDLLEIPEAEPKKEEEKLELNSDDSEYWF